jgi:hypothetical protein
LSSGEAEYYGIMKGCAEALGAKGLAEDFGWKFEAVVKTDSSAAHAMGSRRGVGKVRLIETRYLWLQEVVGRGRLRLVKIPRTINFADVLTKYVSIGDIEKFGNMYGWRFKPPEVNEINGFLGGLSRVRWAVEDDDDG